VCRFDRTRVDFRSILRKTDHQRKIAQSIDASRNALGKELNGFAGSRYKYTLVQTSSGSQAMRDVRNRVV
jgi:hypothetical protein